MVKIITEDLLTQASSAAPNFGMRNSQGEFLSFISRKIKSTIIVCYMYIFLHRWRSFLKQVGFRPYQGYGTRKSWYWFLRRAKLIELPLLDWFQLFLRESTKTMPAKHLVLGNCPWLSGPSLLRLNQGCRYVFLDLFVSVSTCFGLVSIMSTGVGRCFSIFWQETFRP